MESLHVLPRVKGPTGLTEPIVDDPTEHTKDTRGGVPYMREREVRR